MVFIEKFCYRLGGFIADCVLVGSAPISVIVGLKGWSKFSAFANRVALTDKSPEGITKNVFSCLEYLNY